MTSQSIFCAINAPLYKINSYFTFVYAANSGAERKILWRNLHQNKCFVSNNPWCIIGDMNVTLKPNEHSNGSSSMTADMTDFQDCLNLIEVEDISSTGLFYTWTKNLHKVKKVIS